jgi:hypothetical protein
MASLDARHVDAYKRWGEIKGHGVEVSDANGNKKTLNVPTFADNFRFFLKYQVGHMYLRYFMWNFAGKQNDTQAYGDRFFGNWISGIPFIDNWRLGDQSQISDAYKNQKSQNKYYFIPLLIGILGIVFQLKNDKQNFWIALTLFLFTGPAIVVYLNEVPITPRERDYVQVGSFMVFALWIGLGAAAILQTASKYLKRPLARWIVAAIIIALLPGLMLGENYDDHDRSDRYAARDFGKNMLSSCGQNAILFTTADNDTYPIWYLQQVEDFRPDIRQILTTFLPIGWYDNQLDYNHPGSGSVPISFKDEELLMTTNQYFPVMPRIDSSIDVKELVQFVRNNDKRTQLKTNDGEVLNFLPGKNLSLAVDAENFLNGSSLLQMNKSDVPAKINFTITKNYLTRDELLILDILVNNNWQRPVYAIYPSLFQEFGLADYLHREGMVYRLLPYKNNNILHDQKTFDLHQHKLITEDFVWGNVNDPDVFLDHTTKQMTESFRFRQMFAEIAEELIVQGEFEKAEELIDLSQTVFPQDKFPLSYFSAGLARCYYKIGATEKGDTLVRNIYNSASQNLNYFTQGKTINGNNLNNEAQLQLYLIQELVKISRAYKRPIHDQLVDGYIRYF